MVDVGLSQAKWFEGPLLDEGDFQSFFQFPHKRERVIERFEEVVEWDEHFLKIWFSIKRTMDIFEDRMEEKWFWLWWLVSFQRHMWLKQCLWNKVCHLIIKIKGW